MSREWTLLRGDDNVIVTTPGRGRVQISRDCGTSRQLTGLVTHISPPPAHPQQNTQIFSLHQIFFS